MKKIKTLILTHFRLKTILIISLLIVCTGSDLLVKNIIQKSLRVIPKEFDIAQFEQYITKYDESGIIKSSYKLSDNKYQLTETSEKRLHILWKELRKFRFDKEIIVFNNIWHFVYETNEDVGFSVLSFLDNIMSPDGKKNFLIFLQGTGVLLIFAFFLVSKEKYQLYPLALIVTGALGNVIDRIINGYVIDYVMWIFKFIPHRLFNPWPIFNLADVYTVIGAISLFVLIFIMDKKIKQ